MRAITALLEKFIQVGYNKNDFANEVIIFG